jgi:hypothetical protein
MRKGLFDSRTTMAEKITLMASPMSNAWPPAASPIAIATKT